MNKFLVISYMLLTICVATGTTQKYISKRATIFDFALILVLWPLFWMVYLIPGTIQFWKAIFHNEENNEKAA